MSKTETAQELIDYWDRLNNRSDSDAKVGELARRVERVLSYCEEDQSPVRERLRLCRQIVQMLNGAK